MYNHYNNKHVLITGGAGFIGSHLAHALVAQGARVTVLDNLSSGTLTNIKDILSDITFIQGDIREYHTCFQATNNQEIVFHCAAFVWAAQSVNKPQECFDTNVNGTLNLLWAAHNNNVARFIFSSSAAVYGNQEGICHEELMPRPLSPYGDSKRIGELLCKHFYQAHNLITVCLRYFNVYGEGQSHTGPYAPVMAKFRYCMQNNMPITIFGDGNQTRDFVSVETVVNANLTLALLPSGRAGGTIVNVASGTSTSLNQLLKELKKEFPQYTQPIQYLPERKGDIRQSRADINKFQLHKKHA